MPQAVEQNRVATEQEQAEAAIAQEKERPTAANSDAGQGESGVLEGGGQAVEESCEETIKLPPILLIYDGHGSHTTLDWVTLARSNNIILFCVPPHTTH